jgi:hypothetical protein
MAEMCERGLSDDRRVQSSGEREGMVKAKRSAGIGLRVCWKSPGSRVRSQWPPTGARARAEEEEVRGFAGRFAVVVAVVVMSLLLLCRRGVSALLVFTVTHSHAHARGEEGCRHREKKTDAASEACEEVRPGAGYAGGLLPPNCACMNAMPVHGGAPITATRLSPILSNGPVEAARLTPVFAA